MLSSMVSLEGYLESNVVFYVDIFIENPDVNEKKIMHQVIVICEIHAYDHNIFAIDPSAVEAKYSAWAKLIWSPFGCIGEIGTFLSWGEISN